MTAVYTVWATIRGTETVDIRWYSGTDRSKAVTAMAQAATADDDTPGVPDEVRFKTLSVRLDIQHDEIEESA